MKAKTIFLTAVLSCTLLASACAPAATFEATPAPASMPTIRATDMPTSTPVMPTYTPQPTPTQVPTSTPLPPTYTPRPTATSAPTLQPTGTATYTVQKKATPSATKAPATAAPAGSAQKAPPPATKTPAAAAPAQKAVPTATKAPAASPPQSATGILISLYRSGYSQFGRPAGMDDISKGCGNFDNSRPVKQFQAVMKITNTSQKPMQKWYLFVMKTGNAQAYTCYYEYLPEIPPGESRDVTFGAFVELNEQVVMIIVVDAVVGKSNVLTIPSQ